MWILVLKINLVVANLTKFWIWMKREFFFWEAVQYEITDIVYRYNIHSNNLK